jgi:serine/threonine protein kinase
VQKSLDAGVRWDRQGEERAFIIQEWVDGDSLEDLLRRRGPAEPFAGAVIRSILDQLLGGIIIPLWADGTVGWDVRDPKARKRPRAGSQASRVALKASSMGHPP